MKNLTIKFVIAGLSLFAISCNNGSDKQEGKNQDTTKTETTKTETASTVAQEKGFDINSIRLAENFEGSFPYFKLPEGYTFTDPNKYHGKGVIKNVDKEYFYNHGIYFPMEGKSFKAIIRIDDEKYKDKQFSALEVQKSFDELLTSLGGVKINNGEPIQSSEKDRLKSLDPNAYTNGYLHSCNNYDNVHTYIIRTKEKSIFLQYNLGSEGANITVLEPEVFENKMSIIPATEIQKQLDEKGKAVLYINFDTDKATLKADGKAAVAEIATALNADKSLKITINGFTDNTGDKNHNLQLSKQRAETVKNELVKIGISASRLASNGFGQSNPIADNSFEDGKAQNRRVELVKTK